MSHSLNTTVLGLFCTCYGKYLSVSSSHHNCLLVCMLSGTGRAEGLKETEGRLEETRPGFLFQDRLKTVPTAMPCMLLQGKEAYTGGGG